MSSHSHDSNKKNSSVLDKIGQKISNIKEDIADNIERRKQSHNNINANQTHFTTRANMIDESLVIEKKPPTPPESQLCRTSGKNRKRIITFDKRKRIR
jgi:hypothetical protein